MTDYTSNVLQTICPDYGDFHPTFGSDKQGQINITDTRKITGFPSISEVQGKSLPGKH